jgi:hypothetical protein
MSGSGKIIAGGITDCTACRDGWIKEGRSREEMRAWAWGLVSDG